MNAMLDSSEAALLTGNGANTAAATAGTADMHVQLASNSDFTDALKQVMHVAALADANGNSNPMRVEIEIQTPPGAIVNVYVSKQTDGDGWRAQLSTNDPVALAYVQSQMTSLKSSDAGVDVKWLPPQLESTGTIATSGAQDSNLSWNQGGQGQSNYQQQDERQQSSRQQNADDTSEFAAASSNQFMNTLTALGRAA